MNIKIWTGLITILIYLFICKEVSNENTEFGACDIRFFKNKFWSLILNLPSFFLHQLWLLR